MTDLSVAQTILEQLGGQRFVAMTGADMFVGSPDSLAFRIPKAKDGINRVVVRLTPDDLYTVQFWCVNFRRGEATLVRETDHIYFDSLCTVFEDATGLYTSL